MALDRGLVQLKMTQNAVPRFSATTLIHYPFTAAPRSFIVFVFFSPLLLMPSHNHFYDVATPRCVPRSTSDGSWLGRSYCRASFLKSRLRHFSHLLYVPFSRACPCSPLFQLAVYRPLRIRVSPSSIVPSTYFPRLCFSPLYFRLRYNSTVPRSLVYKVSVSVW